MLTTPHPDAGSLGRGASRSGSSARRQRCSCRRPRSPVTSTRWPREVDADVVFVDPMLPLGHLVPRLAACRTSSSRTAPRSPCTAGSRSPPRSAVGCCATPPGSSPPGEYPARQAARVAGRPLPTLVVPPGVDADRFRPATTRHAPRDPGPRLGLDPDAPLVVGVSRLVPRKGFDVVLDAVAGLDGVQSRSSAPAATRARLARRAPGARAGPTCSGAVPDDRAAEPVRVRRRVRHAVPRPLGRVEAEGFGIVFLEAAACGVPSVAGRSGGSAEAVVDGETGVVVEPRDVDAARDAIAGLLGDEARRRRLGAAAGAPSRRRGVLLRPLAARLGPLAAG